MRGQRSGTLVNVSSIAGEVPQPFTAPYGMAKAAVWAMGVSPLAEHKPKDEVVKESAAVR